MLCLQGGAAIPGGGEEQEYRVRVALSVSGASQVFQVPQMCVQILDVCLNEASVCRTRCKCVSNSVYIGCI